MLFFLQAFCEQTPGPICQIPIAYVPFVLCLTTSEDEVSYIDDDFGLQNDQGDGSLDDITTDVETVDMKMVDCRVMLQRLCDSGRQMSAGEVVRVQGTDAIKCKYKSDTCDQVFNTSRCLETEGAEKPSKRRPIFRQRRKVTRKQKQKHPDMKPTTQNVSAIKCKYKSDTCDQVFNTSGCLETEGAEKPSKRRPIFRQRRKVTRKQKRKHTDMKPTAQNVSAIKCKYKSDTCNQMSNRSGCREADGAEKPSERHPIFSPHSRATSRRNRKHTSIKLGAQDVSNSAFSNNDNISADKCILTDVKPYRCNTCNKAYSTSGTLNRHKRIHTGQNLHVCGTCEKAFSCISKLEEHERIHSGVKPFVCNVCDKAFRQNATLTVHKRLHSGEQLSVCDVCEKVFNTSWRLRRHRLVHTKMKLFRCNLCDTVFRRRNSLTAHKRKHAGRK